jgi:RecA-family ATPase
MRAATVKERRDMLGVAIATYRPDIVILDGIADLLTDINDGPKAQELMEQLLHLADEYDCNITTVIHLNRSGEKSNLRGWLGSALMQKSFEVFNCAPIGQGELFSVEMNTSRKYRNDQKLYYRIGDDGIPVMVQHCEQGRDAQGRFTSTVDKTEALNQDYIIHHDDAERSWEWDLRRLFADAMGNVPSMSSEQLMEAVMKLSHIRQKQYYYRVLDEAVAKGVIIKTFDRYKRVTFILSPPR